MQLTEPLDGPSPAETVVMYVTRVRECETKTFGFSVQMRKLSIVSKTFRPCAIIVSTPGCALNHSRSSWWVQIELAQLKRLHAQ